MLPLVSVVITTYNRYELAQRAIRDVLSQTYPNIELIVVEDNSKTGLNDWITQFSTNKVKYYQNNERLGLAKSRNKGSELAAGAYIAFMDDDCRWLPEKIELQIDVALNSKHNKIMVYCGTSKEENGELVPDVTPDQKGLMKEYIYKGSLLAQSSILISKKNLLSIGGNSKELVSCIDHDLWFKMASNGFYMDLPKGGLVYYPEHNSARMHKNLDQRLEGITYFINKWKSSVVDEYDKKSWAVIERKYYIQTVLTIFEEVRKSNIHKAQAQDYFKKLYNVFGLKYNFFDKLALNLSNENFTSPIYYTPIRKKYPFLFKTIITKPFIFFKNKMTYSET
jgi:glycosyltransferase involved in cell wall biosynthesis